jgi:hypothetical protein
VLKRIFGWFGHKPEPRVKAPEPLPLCRLRHATLHPGASLWTPGVGGGNLGGGAATALDEVGLGGEVVVGFQSGAREPVHRTGVIARIDERIPFPESWNPEGLGATHRYRLTGLRRIQIDSGSTSNKRVPTVIVRPDAERPEDLAPAPQELREILDALSKLENPWPDHWLEAFLALPRAPLGQWATTLGWRLSREERLMLFDEPQRITEVLLSTLDGLHLGLAPERRREAVRVQTLTRRTSIMPEVVLEVLADEDGWAIFHPADIHTSANATQPIVLPIFPRTGPSDRPGSPHTPSLPMPLTSATERPRAAHITLENHFARGNVVAVEASPGRCCRVRLTGLSLAPDEEARKQGDSSFRLLIRHGRLFLGGGTLLRAGSYQERLEFADPARWFDVPNGVYQAVVSSLNPADPADGRSCVDYVVQLRASETLEEIVPPRTTPSL